MMMKNNKELYILIDPRNLAILNNKNMSSASSSQKNTLKTQKSFGTTTNKLLENIRPHYGLQTTRE